jgi:hypothetical protein
MITPDNALHQAHAAAATYMEHGLRDLCAALDIDRGLKGWPGKARALRTCSGGNGDSGGNGF